MQSALRLVFPPQCLACGDVVSEEFGLCPTCWRDTPFISGLVCTCCGLPLPGDADAGDVRCDDCLQIVRPWAQGRAALLYRDNGRKMVLALKHGDRLDLVRPAARWMARAMVPMLAADLLVAPIPLHRYRFFRRRYNQSALLSGALARIGGMDHCPDLLVRRRATETQEGKGRDQRFQNLAGAIGLHPKRAAQVAGRRVLLVDDVMTSGATFAAAADACLAGGATEVLVAALARVAKDG